MHVHGKKGWQDTGVRVAKGDLATIEYISGEWRDPYTAEKVNPNTLMPESTVDGNASLGKVNAYRRGVDQLEAATVADASGITYCANFRAIHPTRLAQDRVYLTARPSPFPNLANSLFTFMVQRENASYILLGCEALLGKPDRITPITNAAGVVIDAIID